MKYLDSMNESVLKFNIERALPYLEENKEDGLVIETLVPASAGQYMPFEFLDMFEQRHRYTQGDDVYALVDEIMDEINEELKEVEMLQRDYPYLNFLVGWHSEDGISLLAYPIS